MRSLYVKIFGRGLWLKATALLVLFLCIVKVVNIRLVIRLEKCGPFPDFQYGFGLHVQLQIFWQLYLVELLGILISVGLLRQWHIIYPMLLTRCSILVFFTNLNLTKFQVRFLTSICLFSIIDSFDWFLIASLCKNI